ncbi:AAA family ATPase [Pantoea agglomerans]|uniref:AAA family ATPase n=1 Tax=Enterobacter agglomerans TaxID=549 RepID=UPI0013BE6D87|nr:AAA family ATPase [Pantoea agglomerans]NEG57637.1 AAA family ATPase [Pantoea agglomerans]NEG97339.1 AAA family ATPase [Pantoea agglomerans]NEH02807.1 AAA family ATPase [Pantoea agglomerans]NEH16235.1 AAA family ATPase [Pantoea agglomerans]
MIVGIFLRYYKTYSGTHYIPLSSGSQFCGIVGNNGIGKSSVLEALDSFINNKPWSVNTSFKKAGSDRPAPHIVPLFLLKHDELHESHHEKARILSNLVLGYHSGNSDITVTPTTRGIVTTFSEHIKKLKRNIDISKYFLIPLGVEKDGSISISILNGKSLSKLSGLPESENKIPQATLSDMFDSLMYHVRYKYEYIYIPKDIDSASFTKLEANEVQKLMGESLEQIISQRISSKTIGQINTGLTNFLTDVEKELEEYSYRTSGERQLKIKKKDVYNLIIEAFFNVRKLNKRQNGEWIEINSLSSGEKQRAIMDIAYGFLTNHRENGDNLIIGIDEPECSLHMSACFEQFEKLYSISNIIKQLIFTSHWYGYLPTVENGCTTAIMKNNGEHHFELYDLASYREEVRKKTKTSSQGMPFDIKIKSVNDLIQSIISSCLADKPYNWLICEGSTEKNYLSHYLGDLVAGHRLRIVPVGGASEVKKIFKHLEASYDEFKKDMVGKVFLLSDTDAELVNYETPAMPHIVCKRIVNHGGKTKLVDISSNPVSPATEIEDCLNPKVFIEVLKEFTTDYNFLSELIPTDLGVIEETSSSSYSMDLRPRSKIQLDTFFDAEGIKYEFSKKYQRISREGEFRRPEWIDLIEKFFTSDKPVKFI